MRFGMAERYLTAGPMGFSAGLRSKPVRWVVDEEMVFGRPDRGYVYLGASTWRIDEITQIVYGGACSGGRGRCLLARRTGRDGPLEFLAVVSGRW